MTYLVYPGAEHTRFQHSLGVMHLSSAIFDEVAGKGDLVAKWGDEEIKRCRQLIRLYGLLHDLGHAPFSHAAEKDDPEENLFSSDLDHEQYSRRIIQETKISKLVEQTGVSTRDLIGLMSGTAPDPHFRLLRQVMNSELDVDKIDYLLRDSLFCGVAYGLFDLPRLLSSLTVYTRGTSSRLALDEGGLQVAEAFVLARYYMFTQVYFHRTRRLFDYMIRKFILDLLGGGKLPVDIDQFLAWDDIRVDRELWERAGGRRRNHWAHAITARKLMKRIYESGTHAGELELQRLRWTSLRLKEKGFSPTQVFVDGAYKLPHKFPRNMKDDPDAVNILTRRGKAVAITERSELVRKLTEPINILRVYAARAFEKRVEKVIEEVRRIASGS